MENLNENGLIKLDQKQVQLAQLIEKNKGLTIAGITDKEGYLAVDKARKEFKAERVQIEKDAYELREGAIRFQKAVIAKEKELIAIISPYEKSYQKLTDEVDAEIERLKLEEQRKENERIQNRINQLAAVGHAIDLQDAKEMSEPDYQELLKSAQDAHAQELARKKAEQEEADRIRREEDARRERERKELEEQRLKQEARERELQRIEAEKIKEERLRQEAIRKEEEERQRIIKAEREKLEAEKRKFEEEKRAEQQRKEAEELARKQAEQRAIEEQRAKEKAEQEARLKAEREEALRPDKEILKTFADSLNTIRVPTVKTKEAEVIRLVIIDHIREMIERVNNRISSL